MVGSLLLQEIITILAIFLSLSSVSVVSQKIQSWPFEEMGIMSALICCVVLAIPEDPLLKIFKIFLNETQKEIIFMKAL